MALNKYFSNTKKYGINSERDLYDDLIIESMQIHGVDVHYIPRKIVKQDFILNEDLISRFDDAFVIEMYVDSTESFEGDGELMQRFGLEIRDQVTLTVSSRRWNQLIGRHGYDENSTRPKEGDLIHLPMSDGLFEIKFVDDKKPFFQLGQQPTFKLVCELFEYESQEIDTGIEDVDDFQSNNSAGFSFEVNSEVGSFEIGETISFTLPGGVTGSVEFLDYKFENDMKSVNVGTLTFDDGKYHNLIEGTTLTGGISGSTASISKLYDLEDGDQFVFENDEGAQNSAFATNVDEFIDFSEKNPFGEPFNY